MTASPTPAAPVPKTPAATPPQQASTPSPAPIASPLRPASASGLRPLDLQPSEVPVQADHELLHGDPWADALAAGRSSPVRTPSNAKDGSVRKYVDYRLDPAPVWGGDQPEKNFKEYQRNLQLWLVEAEARLPHNLIGKRILDSIPLGSKLSALLAHLTVDEITAENGHKIIVGLIESAHEYLKDHRLEQAFEEAIFRGKRDKGTSLTAFLTSKRAAFAELRKQGLDLLETSAGRHLLGHLILRQGAFSQDQKQRLKVVTNGSIDFKDLELAIQKVFGDKLDDAQHEAPHPHHPRRWRSNAYFDEEGDDADWDDEAAASTCGEFYEEEEDWFEDLIALNDDGSEAQLVFPQELPVVMDEHEAIETFGSGLEEVFYEFQNRLHHGKGRGKGKKGKGGKGKRPARTYGQSAPSHGKGGGGHLEHRRLLQASRNGRGYDRPWQQRQGSRMSLSEIKSKTRCHQCKQIGHWSRECPQKGKMLGSSASSPARSVMSGNSMSTGFFTEPPKLMSGFGQFLTVVDGEKNGEYMLRDFTGLSFVFLNSTIHEGTALVDTAAQHGLVGYDTLVHHDRYLQQHHGLQVQWSAEQGGTVRGVCGQEETTKVGYIPIGLGGRSGVLRVQIVPGQIPILIPAYFLTQLEAVIDMKHCAIMFMKIGICLKMCRQPSGHVSINICEFGDGFHIPADYAFSSSKAWSIETIPDWTALALSDAQAMPLPRSLAALATAALPLCFPSGPPDPVGAEPHSSTTCCQTDPAAAREAREKSSGFATIRAADHGGSHLVDVGTFGIFDDDPRRGSSPTTCNDPRSRQVLGAQAGTKSLLQPHGDQARRQPPYDLDPLRRMSPGTENASHATGSADHVERATGLCEVQLLRRREGEGEVRGQEEEVSIQTGAVSYKSVPQESPTRVSHRVSHKSVAQECPTRVSYKSVPEECPTRVSHKSVRQE